MTTWDPAKKDASITLSGGNLTATGTLSGFRSVLGTTSHDTSGTNYFEVSIGATVSNFTIVGIGNASTTLGTFLGLDFNSMGWVRDGRVLINNSTVLTIATWAGGDVLSLAINFSTKKAWFRKNAGNWNNDVIGNQDPANGIGGVSFSTLLAGPYFPGFTADANGDVGTANFGGSAFSQSVPSGFVAWDTNQITLSRGFFVG